MRFLYIFFFVVYESFEASEGKNVYESVKEGWLMLNVMGKFMKSALKISKFQLNCQKIAFHDFSFIVSVWNKNRLSGKFPWNNVVVDKFSPIFAVLVIKSEWSKKWLGYKYLQPLRKNQHVARVWIGETCEKENLLRHNWLNNWVKFTCYFFEIRKFSLMTVISYLWWNWVIRSEYFFQI